MTTRELTCIVCPRGCQLTVELDEGKVLNVSGNVCPRGKVYAENECINPQRTVTTTIKCSDGSVVPVKTDTTIPKSEVMRCMQIINSGIAELPVNIGDVLIKDVFGSNVVATDNRA